MRPSISPAQEQELLARNPRKAVLLVFAYRDDGDAPQQPDIQALSDKTVQFPLIGESVPPWSRLCIRRYPDPQTALTDARARCDETGLDSILAFQAPPQRARRSIAVLRAAMRLLPKPRRDAAVDSHLHADPRNPTAEALRQLEQMPARPVDMFNLLKFTAPRGQQAYYRYGVVAMQTVFRQGGDLPVMGRYLLTLANSDGNPQIRRWDELAVMRYPAPEAFLRMVHNRKYQKALVHRDAGLADTWVIATA